MKISFENFDVWDFRLDKDELGETKIVRLSSLGLHKNLSPYNAYKQGKLVKLPFLGSQYINLND